MVREILAAFGLTLVWFVVLGIGHRGGRLVAVALTGAVRSRPLEFVRLLAGIVVEVVVFVMLTIVLVLRWPGPAVETPSGRMLSASLLVVAVSRPAVLAVWSYIAPSVFLEARVLRYLLTGHWFERTGEELRLPPVRRLWAARTDPGLRSEVIVDLADLGEQRLERGEPMGRRARRRHDLARMWKAHAANDLIAVIEISRAILSANPSNWGGGELVALHMRSHALLSLREDVNAAHRGTLAAILGQTGGEAEGGGDLTRGSRDRTRAQGPVRVAAVRCPRARRARVR